MRAATRALQSGGFGALAVTAVAAVYFATFVAYGLYLEDEGMLLFQIARTFRGQVPYVDFHTGYTPGSFYLNAALFWLFGESVLPVRVLLVAVNAATIGLLFSLARPLAGGALAAVAALGYAAFLPFARGQFASFNIPYPTWYANLAFLGAQAAMHRHLAREGRGALLAAGLLSGVAFSFKPNVGVLAVLASGLSLAIVAAGRVDPDRHLARAILWLGTAALLAIFWPPLRELLSGEATPLEVPFLAGPPLLLVVGRAMYARANVPHRFSLSWAIVLVASGTAILVAPWALYFLVRLGPYAFARDVLLLGSGVERIYAIAYPFPSTFPDLWGPVLSGTLLAFTVVVLRTEQRETHLGRLAGWSLFAGVLLLVGLWGRQLLGAPEGWHVQLVSQVLNMGFVVVPVLGCAAVIRILWRLCGDRATLDERGRLLLATLVFALCMYIQVYPRADSMHLIAAMPSMLMLGAAAAARLARAWAVAGHLPKRWQVAATAGVGAVLAAAAAVPNFSTLFDLGWRGVHSLPRTALRSQVAPVFVESSRAGELRALNGVLDFLGPRLRPGEAVFGFPAVSLVPFLLKRPNPVPHDYFFPGRPDHRDEAEVVRTLEATRPRYVVTLNRYLDYFSDAPAFFFLLRHYLRDEYVLAGRFERYDVLRRRDDGPAQQAMVVDRGDHLRAIAAKVVEVAGGPQAVMARVGSLTSSGAGQVLFLKNLGRFGDARVVPFLLEVATTGPGRLRDAAAEGLNRIALRFDSEQYIITRGGTGPERLTGGGAIPLERLRAWLQDPAQRPRVGVFAARALADAEDVEAVPVLEAALRAETQPVLRTAFGKALVRLGRPERAADLVALLGIQQHEVQDAVPSFLIDMASRYPAEVGAALARGLADGNALAREVCAWIAGAASLRMTAPALRRALDDPAVGVGVAATWALGVLGDVRARPTLARLAERDDSVVRAFAREACARLDGATIGLRQP